MKRFLIAGFVVALVFAGVVFPTTSKTAKAATLEEQIQALVAQLQALQALVAQQQKGASSVTPSGNAIPATKICDTTGFVGLKKGSRGDAVTKLQKFLSANGYLNAKATGFYGAMTELAVKDFQDENNIDSTGVIDSATASAFVSASSCGSAGNGGANSGPSATSTPTSTTPVITSTDSTGLLAPGSNLIVHGQNMQSSVILFDNSTVLTPYFTDANSVAVYLPAFTSIGNHQIKAKDRYSGLVSNTLPITVVNNPITTPTSKPTLSILSPSYGESVQSGSQYNIRWSERGGNEAKASYTVYVLDTKTMGNVQNIVQGLSSSGAGNCDAKDVCSYTWNVPSYLSGTYNIVVVDKGNNLMQISSNFTIGTQITPTTFEVQAISPLSAVQLGTAVGQTVGVFKIVNNGSSPVTLPAAVLTILNGGTANTNQMKMNLFASSQGGSQVDSSYFYGANIPCDKGICFDLSGVSEANRTIYGSSYRYITVKTASVANNGDTFTLSMSNSGGTTSLATVTLRGDVSGNGPTISSINPSTVRAGDTITVSGINFDSASYIALNNQNQSIFPTTYTANSLSFVVPSNLTAGTYTFTIAEKASSLASNGTTFTLLVGDPAVYLTVSKDAYSSDSQLNVSVGDSFTLKATVKNATPQANGGFSVLDYNYGTANDCKDKVFIGNGGFTTTCTVKISATSVYQMTLYDGSKTVTSNKVTVTAKATGSTPYPTITSISPNFVKNSNPVTISGSNLTGVTTIELYDSNGSFRASMSPASVSDTSVTFSPDEKFIGNTNPGTYQLGVVTNQSCAGGCNSNRLPFTMAPDTVFPQMTTSFSYNPALRTGIQFNWYQSFSGSAEIIFVASDGREIMIGTPSGDTGKNLTTITPSVDDGTYTLKICATPNSGKDFVCGLGVPQGVIINTLVPKQIWNTEASIIEQLKAIWNALEELKKSV